MRSNSQLADMSSRRAFVCRGNIPIEVIARIVDHSGSSVRGTGIFYGVRCVSGVMGECQSVVVTRLATGDEEERGCV